MGIDPSQKNRVSEAMARLLSAQTHSDYLELLRTGKHDEARQLIGLEEGDLEAANDYFGHYAPFLAELNDSAKHRVVQALERLLDPATMQQFIQLWPSDRAAALQTISLSTDDLQAYQLYLGSFIRRYPRLPLPPFFWSFPIERPGSTVE